MRTCKKSLFFTIIAYNTQHFKTKRELIKAMNKWIRYYNCERIRHTLKGLTPIEYRNQALKKYC
ncbi:MULTISPECIES: IS3 family transposase [Lactobacillus]|uniref:IS3 family transposase n=1 Tax=Lactobacillus TaxID=1578 RepID=UPI001396B733|nr:MULTISPECIES: IS3 family transposase [Lactobacillus]MCW8124286.1 integrase core domain-containing protein [Lactobacillus mulieris]MDK7327501.1 IS3 family transposase [Lactobacillus mulieris]